MKEFARITRLYRVLLMVTMSPFLLSCATDPGANRDPDGFYSDGLKALGNADVESQVRILMPALQGMDGSLKVGSFSTSQRGLIRELIALGNWQVINILEERADTQMRLNVWKELSRAAPTNSGAASSLRAFMSRMSEVSDEFYIWLAPLPESWTRLLRMASGTEGDGINRAQAIRSLYAHGDLSIRREILLMKDDNTELFEPGAPIGHVTTVGDYISRIEKATGSK